jgi:cytochrome P450
MPPFKRRNGATAPGPFSINPFGSLPAVQRDPLRSFTRAREKYGDVVRFRAGIWFAYLVAHPDDVKHVLQDNNPNYLRGYTYQYLIPVVGLGLLTNEGASWLQQRRLAQPAFHRQRLASIAGVMTDSAVRLLERWDQRADDEPLDIAAEMMRLALEIVGRTLLGSDLGAEADAVRQAVKVGQEHVNFRATRLFTLPEKYPTPRNRRFLSSVQVLDEVVYRVIEERRRREEDTGDLLSMLLLAQDEDTGERMNDKQLRDEVMTIFLAGHETTANALAWTWYLLSGHPEVEAKLHAELEAVLGGRPPTVEDLGRLTYTRMVLDESMRLYPPAWAMGRFSVNSDVIGGYELPAHQQVLVSPYVTHRHPEFWDDPEGFDPERFRPELVGRRPRYAYFPFGGGPRRCIGNDFAIMESLLVLATVAQKYRLRLVPGHPVEPEPLITLRPRYGLKMELERRTAPAQAPNGARAHDASERAPAPRSSSLM